MQEHYIVGRKDNVKRRVSYIPTDGTRPKTFSENSFQYVWVLLELSPGHVVRQLVLDSRIQQRKVNKYGQLLAT